MRLVIKENYDLLCEYVANYVIDRINKFNPTQEKPFVLGTCRLVDMTQRTPDWILAYWRVQETGGGLQAGTHLFQERRHLQHGRVRESPRGAPGELSQLHVQEPFPAH